MPLSKKADAERKRQKRAEAKAKTDAAEMQAAMDDLDDVVMMAEVEAAAELDDEKARDAAEAVLTARASKYWEKNRVWAGIVYPESLPQDWSERMMLSGLAIAVSPLHDKDKKTDGTDKKPHYHVIAAWSGPTTYAVAAKFFRQFRGTIPIGLQAPRGYYRYFTHADCPNKAQYDKADILHFNGFSPSDFLDLTKAEVNEIKRRLQRLCLEQGFRGYSELMDYLLFNGEPDEYDIASTQTMFFSHYLRDKQYLAERPIQKPPLPSVSAECREMLAKEASQGKGGDFARGQNTTQP